jgi:LmbE family N-acetylglucosaminyl deacetylase
VLALGVVRSLVVLGAHPDDIEIAAGGLLLSLAAANPRLAVRYVVVTGEPHRQAEARDAAAAFLPDASVEMVLRDLPDGHLPAHWGEVKHLLHEVAARGTPDLVVAPWVGDAHQDHRLIGELVPTVFRGVLHLQYEIPKWDGDLGQPNVYLPLSPELARRKATLLDKHFPSQHARSWWGEELFLAVARLRGVECGSRYAEAFHCRKAVLTLNGVPQ